MKEFTDKIAVITGAASGIGRGIAERCAQEGMKVVLADIEEKALTHTTAAMKSAGATVLAVVTDVSKIGEIEALAQKTLDAFGAVHLLCNNAGVGQDTSQGWNIWEHTLDDWKWFTSVNLWGVIHGVKTFVPIMLEQDTTCHIVNTASIAGLLSFPYVGIYNVTKHAIVTLSETLHRELRLRKAKINVSVLCPAWVDTQLANSARNRPAELGSMPADKIRASENEIQDLGAYLTALYNRYEPEISQQLQTVLGPQHVAELVFQALMNDEFYILTHPSWERWLRDRFEDILGKRNPDIFL